MGAHATVEGKRYIVGNLKMMASEGIDTSGIGDMVAEFEARGQTVAILADENHPLALIALADTPRPQVATTVAELESLGIVHQAMLTGDNAHSAEAAAKLAGLREWTAGLLPEQKLACVREAQARFGAVGMIGDGINDAPALAASNVGIAIGASGNGANNRSDTALETADIALMADDLTRLPYLIRLSRRASTIIRQNIAFSLATKIGLIAAALTVGLPLWLAVAGDVGVSLLVTMNALRLRNG